MDTLIKCLLLLSVQVVWLHRQVTPTNPVIHFCFSNQIPYSGECRPAAVVSNSPFEFGHSNQNVLNFSMYKGESLSLTCKASYPIRWLGHKPLGNVRYIVTTEIQDYDQKFFQYVQKILISSGTEFSRILRCESFSNTSEAAEVFITGNDRAPMSRPLSPRIVSSKYFAVADNASRLQNSNHFIIPCVGTEFYEEHVVRLAKSDEQLQFAEFPYSNLQVNTGTQTIKGNWSTKFNLDTAVEAGYYPSYATAFVCRYIGTGEAVVGHYYARHTKCFFATGKQYSSDTSIEILVTDSSGSYAWTPQGGGAIHNGAVEGGFTKSKEVTYICRAHANLTSGTLALLPGNLIPSKGYCVISYLGVQNEQSYEILVDARYSCNSRCKSVDISPRRGPSSSGRSYPEGILKYRTSKGLWSNRFDAKAAVEAGYEPGVGKAYVCQAEIQSGELLSGKYYPRQNRLQGCFYVNGSKEWQAKIDNTLKVLMNDASTAYGWTARSNGSIVDGAIEAGHIKSGETSFVCRAIWEDKSRNKTVLLPGFLVPSEGVCSVPYGGVNKLQSYEILVDMGCSCSSYIYDARMGFRLTARKRHQVAYSCYSQRQATYNMSALSKDWKVNADLYLSNKTGGEQSIFCDIQRNHSNDPDQRVDLRFGACNSVIECDLKFRPMPPLISLPIGSKLEADDMEILTSTKQGNSVISSHNHGYVQCTAMLSRSAVSNLPGFVSEADHMFTGLDNQKYLISRVFPTAAIVSIQKNSNSIVYTCKISTFVLIPSVYFEITYSDDKVPSKLMKRGYAGPDGSVMETKTDEKSLVNVWYLYLTLVEDVAEVACHARWINSPRWASAKISLKTTTESSGSTADPNGAGDSKLDKYTIIGCALAAVIFLLMVVPIFVLWRKYQKSKKQVIQRLTDTEIEEFHKGEKNQAKDAKGVVPIESLAFNPNMVIMSSKLKTDEQVLGKGEFGIVHKGTFENQSVAVKSCQPNADLDYFRAFLKEIKVMSYIGEHENIVKFHGAVVDKIQEGTCFVVMELCPFGNLSGYLREHARTYTDICPSFTTNRAHESENHYQNVVLNRSVLNSFSRQIASGMEFLSGRKVIHGDLAARNVLVFPNNVVKITDFGLSRKLYNCKNYTKTKKTPLPWRWMALESLRFFQFSTQSDVWSFGVTIWEIFSFAEIPYAGLNWTTDLVNEIESGLRLSKPNHASQQAFKWMMMCWKNDPDDRPTFSECREWFSNLD